MARDIIAIQVEKMYEDVILPEYKCDGDSGMDIRAYFTDDFLNKIRKDMISHSDNFPLSYVNIEKKSISLLPNHRILIPTGIKTIIPNGYEIQVRPRSGLSIKNGITVLNSPGTIDSGYRHEYGIIIQNNGERDFRIEHGDRIAQIILMPVPKIKWEIIDKVDESDRMGGFGHTGIK